ncbi:amidase family protein [Photobacterium sp. DNB23_23_1]
MKLKASSLFVILALTGCNGSSSNNNSDEKNLIDFSPEEASISYIHSALKAGNHTCEQIINTYVERINAMDRKGPELNAIISVNEAAVERAKKLDENFSETGITGSLHCIPVTVKDNINTSDMLTTGGALANNQPETDAFIVEQIRQAGGIILSKANLHEYAFGYRGGSLLGGVPRNVYDLGKGPGGSSSGTGTAVSGSLALVGIGTDTGGSIRVPSSVQGLIGLRPSMRLLSQDGIMPLAPFQDTAGPMCRSVSDCATFLEAMTGYDTSQYSGQRKEFAVDSELMGNPFEYMVVTGAVDYESYLDSQALSGARIGVVRDLFGSGESTDNQNVQSAMDAALDNMEKLGAIIEDVAIPDLNIILTDYVSLSRYEFSYSLTEYLKSWSSAIDNHYSSFEEVYSSGEYLPSSAGSFDFYSQMGQDRWNNDVYLKNVHERPDFVRYRVLRALDNKDENGDYLGQRYDVLIYPTISGIAGDWGGNPTESGSANRLSPFTGFPALTMPVGYVDSGSGSSLPVGLEMLGREFDEGTLLALAYSYEQAYSPRVEPQLDASMTPPPVQQQGILRTPAYNEKMMN